MCNKLQWSDLYCMVKICHCVTSQTGVAYYHHARLAAAARRCVFCRVWRLGPEAAAPCHLHPLECCCIQWFPPTEHSKPWNPPLLCASLYRPVKNHNVKHEIGQCCSYYEKKKWRVRMMRLCMYLQYFLTNILLKGRGKGKCRDVTSPKCFLSRQQVGVNPSF